MKFFIRLLLATVAANAAEAAIHWGDCNDLPTVSPSLMQCANFSVPLDYTSNSTNNTLKLQLARIPAVSKPSKGSILFNFGGPGAPARAMLASLSNTLIAMTGGEHDLVAFDSRGTGNTIPFQCYDEFSLLMSTENQTPTNSSDVALGSSWVGGQLESRACLETQKNTGCLLGTAFVARDLIQVVDGLEEDGMLRYWGISYGTILGATVAAMFPDRIDRMVLDGVENPHEYYYGTGNFERWTDSDKVLSGFFETCLEMPHNCPMSRNSNAQDLEQKFWDLLYRVKFRPIAVGRFRLDYPLLKLIVSQALFDSIAWPPVATLLQGLFDGEVSPAMETIIAAYQPTTLEGRLGSLIPVNPLSGIHCSDRIPRVKTLDQIMPTVERLYNTSKFYGDQATLIDLTCAQWGFEAKERYIGDFHVRTAFPMLVVSTRYDAQTPLVSAYNVSAGFEGSRVLEINGYGHASLSVPSLCSIEKISAYFQNGTLPEHGLLCEASARPYSGIGWDDIIGGTNQTRLKRSTNGITARTFKMPKSYVPEMQRW
ncbi:Tripeptidyl aminopeptidase [Paramyrothecium foliicola]|nr:Tripeptidyl aminopeptidase [Paramyrothecium foliicola]